MRDECPNCGGDLQAIDDRGSRIACTDCPWMKTPYFEGLPIGSSDDGFEGTESTEGVPERIEDEAEFEIPDIVRVNLPKTELRALVELLKFDGRKKIDIARDLDTTSYSVTAAAGTYEYFRRNGHFEGPEIDFKGDVENHSPENKHKRPSTERDKAFRFFMRNPDASVGEAMEELSPTDLSQSQLAGAKGNARQRLRAEDRYPVPTTETPVETEMETETHAEPAVEFEPELEIESEVEFDSGPETRYKSNGKVKISMPTNAAIDLIIEGKITDETRRKIVEQLVS